MHSGSMPFVKVTHGVSTSVGTWRQHVSGHWWVAASVGNAWCEQGGLTSRWCRWGWREEVGERVGWGVGSWVGDAGGGVGKRVGWESAGELEGRRGSRLTRWFVGS